jgi:hypothetical protein
MFNVFVYSFNEQNTYIKVSISIRNWDSVETNKQTNTHKTTT